ncbi:hypothetical protein D3C87_919480 [compost metagenome]
MRDTGHERTKGRHLFLLDQVRLRRHQRLGPHAHDFFQLLSALLVLQLGRAAGREDRQQQQGQQALVFIDGPRVDGRQDAQGLAIGIDQGHADIAFRMHVDQEAIKWKATLDIAAVKTHALAGHVLARRVLQAVFDIRLVAVAAPQSQGADAFAAIVHTHQPTGDHIVHVERFGQVLDEDAQEVVATGVRRRSGDRAQSRLRQGAPLLGIEQGFLRIHIKQRNTHECSCAARKAQAQLPARRSSAKARVNGLAAIVPPAIA